MTLSTVHYPLQRCRINCPDLLCGILLQLGQSLGAISKHLLRQVTPKEKSGVVISGDRGRQWMSLILGDDVLAEHLSLHREGLGVVSCKRNPAQ